MDIRKHLTRAQKDIFKRLSTHIVYFPNGSSDISTYVYVKAIVSQFFIVQGQPVGMKDSKSFPVFDDKNAEVTFKTSDISNLQKDGIIIVNENEGYKISSVKPSYLGEVTCKCERLLVNQPSTKSFINSINSIILGIGEND